MIFDTLQYVDGSGATQEIAVSLANVAGVPANNKTDFTPRSHAPGAFEISWAQPPETGIAIPFKSRCIVWIGRSSTDGSINSFSGGTMIFQGRRWDNEGSASASGVIMRITLLDAWKDLEKVTYAIPWNYISGGTIASPTYTTYNFQDIVLFQAAPGVTYNPAPVNSTISTWQQLQDILRYAAAFAGGANAVQLQLGGSGTFTGTFPAGSWSASTPEFVPGYCNWYGVRGVKCAQAIIYCLKPHPGVFTEIDYSTSPPTLHFRNRAALTNATLPYKSTDVSGRVHIATDIQALDELVPDAVRLCYKITGTFNGQPVITFGSDCYPTAANSLLCLDYPIDLTGASQTQTIYDFTSAAFDPTALALWRQKINSLKQITEGGQIPNDGDPGALTLLDAAVNGGLSGHPDGLQVVDESGAALDLGTYPYYTDADLFAWMKVGGDPVLVARANLTGFFAYNKKTGGTLNLTPKVVRHSHSIRLKLTNAPSGRYVFKQTVNLGESVPPNLAQNIYTELATLQWRLRHEIIEVAASPTAVPTLIKPGKHKINLSGGDSAWTTMNAVPENVSIGLFRVWVNKNDGTGSEWRLAARHTIQCGPVNHLEPGYLIQLWNLFVDRERSGIDAYQRLTGGVSSQQVDLSHEAARENSVPANADFSQHIVYAPDATNTGASTAMTHDATTGQIHVVQKDSRAGTTLVTGVISPQYTGAGAPGPSTLP
jgi:hypothetical protein